MLGFIVTCTLLHSASSQRRRPIHLRSSRCQFYIRKVENVSSAATQLQFMKRFRRVLATAAMNNGDVTLTAQIACMNQHSNSRSCNILRSPFALLSEAGLALQ